VRGEESSADKPGFFHLVSILEHTNANRMGAGHRRFGTRHQQFSELAVSGALLRHFVQESVDSIRHSRVAPRPPAERLKNGLVKIATIPGSELEPGQDKSRDKRSRIGLVHDPREKQSCQNHWHDERRNKPTHGTTVQPRRAFSRSYRRSF
jgi:hypothetical protein